MTKLVKGLGIESTAHTFGASIVNESGKILSDIRSIYVPPAGSGIHPREASRHHTDVAASVIKQALTESKISKNDLDFISFSAGPGLGPCLRVGAVIARTLCHYLDKPIVPVNHAIGHIEIAAFEAKFFGKPVMNMDVLYRDKHPLEIRCLKKHYDVDSIFNNQKLCQTAMGGFIDLYERLKDRRDEPQRALTMDDNFSLDILKDILFDL